MESVINHCEPFTEYPRLKIQKKGARILREEQVLVQRARDGDRTAFRELVERYKKQIYYLAYDLTGNHHDAEDLSQEVFIKVSTFKFLYK